MSAAVWPHQPTTPRMFPTTPRMFPTTPRMFPTTPRSFPTTPRMSAEESPVLRTVSDLLAAVEQLPPPARAEAHARIDAALEGDARTCRAALGMLALDLAPVSAPADARDLEVRVHVVDLDALPARVSA